MVDHRPDSPNLRSELCGLQWEDIDLGRKLIHVRRSFSVVSGKSYYHEPKTDRSFRAVALDAGTERILREHYESSVRFQAMFGRYNINNVPVFTQDGETPVRPDTLTHAWGRVAKALQLNVRLHDLRHTTATLMLSAGVPVGDVSDRLGHATPGFTLTAYRHAIPGSQEAAAERLANLLNGGDSQPKLGESNDLLTQKLAQNAKNSENSGLDASVQIEIGDGPGTRTPNLVIKSHLLCQLS